MNRLFVLSAMTFVLLSSCSSWYERRLSDIDAPEFLQSVHNSISVEKFFNIAGDLYYKVNYYDKFGLIKDKWFDFDDMEIEYLLKSTNRTCYLAGSNIRNDWNSLKLKKYKSE